MTHLNTVLLNLHYNLGVLILVDTLSATSFSLLLPCEYELRISSARAIVNFVNMVLQTDHNSMGNHSENSNLLQVPYPEHLVSGLSRAGSSLLHLYRTKSVSASMVETSMYTAKSNFFLFRPNREIEFYASDALLVVFCSS
jgi:hypothetical protein